MTNVLMLKKMKGKRGIVENNETQFELSESSSATFNSKQFKTMFSANPGSRHDLPDGQELGLNARFDGLFIFQFFESIVKVI